MDTSKRWVLLRLWLGAVAVCACTGERPKFGELVAPDAMVSDGTTDDDASTSFEGPTRSDETDAGGGSNTGTDATTVVEGDIDASVIATCTPDACLNGGSCSDDHL